MRKCVWVTATGPCNEKVSYKMVDDGGEPGAAKVRKYNAFCDKHEAQLDEDD